MFDFTLEGTLGAARAGTLTLPHGTVRTPAFMPVGTHGVVRGLSAADVRRTGAQIILGNTYHLHIRPGEDVVLRLSVDLAGTSIDAHETFDLASLDLDGNQRGTISRSVLDDPLTSFPQLQRGELTFRRSVISGETIPGEFRVTFVNGTELASGRTAFGTFEATVQ